MMRILGSRRIRLVVAIVSVLLVGLGAFLFAALDRSAADQYASVASFVVGLVGIGLTAWSIHRRDEPSAPNTRPRVHVENSQGVMTGDHAKGEFVFNLDRPSGRRGRGRR